MKDVFNYLALIIKWFNYKDDVLKIVDLNKLSMHGLDDADDG